MISGRISGGIYFYKCRFGIKSLDHVTFKENLANNHISYKTESNTLRSSFQEDKMVRTSAFKIVLWKTLLPLQVWPQKQQKSVQKIWMLPIQSGLLEQCLIVSSPKKRIQEKKKTNKNNIHSKEKLKCRNSAGLVMLQVLNKVRNKLKQLKRSKTSKNHLKQTKTI